MTRPRSWSPLESPPPAPDRTLLSLVVATYNRRELVVEAVDRAAGEIAGRPAEIIVVDDASTDGTFERLLERYGNNPQVHCLANQGNLGPGMARNRGLDLASGQYFLPLDSDHLLLPGAIETVLAAIDLAGDDAALLLFPCLEYPARRRMDSLDGDRDVTWTDLLYGQVSGELIPAARTGHLRSSGLRYPDLRSGGEGVLWIRTLLSGRGRFIDSPILFYRTDSPGRICTVRHQLAHAAECAAIGEALLELFPAALPPAGRRAKAKRLLSTGIYHVLAGSVEAGRERLGAAISLGDPRARLVWLASLAGPRAFRGAFRLAGVGALRRAFS